MTRKGRLKEIFSKALYADDPSLYVIGYRDFNSLVWISLAEFISISENFQLIPITRISVVKREEKIIYQKTIPNLI